MRKEHELVQRQQIAQSAHQHRSGIKPEREIAGICGDVELQAGTSSEAVEQDTDGDGDGTSGDQSMRFFEFADPIEPSAAQASPTQASTDAIAQREKQLKKDKAQVAVKAARDKLTKATAKAADAGT